MKVNIYKCFISSPGDVREEREISKSVMLEINNTIGEKFGFRLEPLMWETDVIATIGKSPQEIVDQFTLGKYDIYIGIMHERFGTPTKKAGSGTEHEFNEAVKRFQQEKDIEIQFYFNTSNKTNNKYDLDIEEFIKVKNFKKKLTPLGLYIDYDSINSFEKKLKDSLSKILLSKIEKKKYSELEVESSLINLLEKRLYDSLTGFNAQPKIWVEPIISLNNQISSNPSENFDNRVDKEYIINSKLDFMISSPPEFGLTCLAHYIIKEAWLKNKFWIYIDLKEVKPHNLENFIKSECILFGKDISNIERLTIDSYSQTTNPKFLKIIDEKFSDVPILILNSIDDTEFFNEADDKNITENYKINRNFENLHLLALPKKQIREVVFEYNKNKNISEDNKLLNKIIEDLEVLNIHRTPRNCITLLKASEKFFDESPVNRTKMLDMVLFVLFNMDSLPTYKAVPDLKDCEFVLGDFCEKIIRNNKFYFTREDFIKNINSYCESKLIELETDTLFDILYNNNIIKVKNGMFSFRSSYWILYFGAKQMSLSEDFRKYIFENKYTSFPEIIEFYTGIDRNREDALVFLSNDIKATVNIVTDKLGLPADMNPFHEFDWNPNEEQIQKMHKEVEDNVINSSLPDVVKDQFDDQKYNQIRPYDQSIKDILEEYSLVILFQKIRASSSALRNSDHADTKVKKELLKSIIDSWKQVTNALIALSPILAKDGNAGIEGMGFILDDSYYEVSDFESRWSEVLINVPHNVISFFCKELSSKKLGPLIFEVLKNEEDTLLQHELAIFLTTTRPNNWDKYVSEYINMLNKNSYFLFSLTNSLRAQYIISYMSDEDLRKTSILIKKCIAKHSIGVNIPKPHHINQVSNIVIPRRDKSINEE